MLVWPHGRKRNVPFVMRYPPLIAELVWLPRPLNRGN